MKFSCSNGITMGLFRGSTLANAPSMRTCLIGTSMSRTTLKFHAAEGRTPRSAPKQSARTPSSARFRLFRLYFADHSASIPVQTGRQYPAHQIVEFNSRLTRRHRHQAVIRHARHGVDLDQPGLVLIVNHQIHPRPARDTHNIARSHGELAATVLQIQGLYRTGSDSGGFGAVLGVEIMKRMGRLQANERQWLTPKNGQR
jgi:hypothetical protein